MKSKNRYLKINSKFSTFIFDPINNSNILEKTDNQKIDIYNRDHKKSYCINHSPLEVLLKEFSF